MGNTRLSQCWVEALDIGGNVWEWVSSIYQPYPYNKDDGRENNINTFSGRVFRGGSWYSDINYIRSAVPYRYDPTSQYDFIGVRYARASWFRLNRSADLLNDFYSVL